MKKLTVIIPVKNGEGTLPRCLKSIADQSVAQDLEIIVLDSGSTDNSREIASVYGARVIPIAPGTFNHGLTRNLGVQAASSGLLYFTVQDAVLADNRMLERMMMHFDDQEVQAVCGHQAIPAEKDKNPALWFKRISEPVPVDKRSLLPENFKSLSPKDQWKYCSWDNVVSMYRRSALLQLPFENTMHTEDWIWCRHALMNNFKLIYDSSVLVYHYHHRFFRFTFSNEYIVSSAFYHYFGKRLPTYNTGIKKIATYCYRVWKNPSLRLGERCYWTLHNIASELAVISSVTVFRSLAIFGEKGISTGSRVFCKSIPVGQQKKSS